MDDSEVESPKSHEGSHTAFSEKHSLPDLTIDQVLNMAGGNRRYCTDLVITGVKLTVSCWGFLCATAPEQSFHLPDCRRRTRQGGASIAGGFRERRDLAGKHRFDSAPPSHSDRGAADVLQLEVSETYLH